MKYKSSIIAIATIAAANAQGLFNTSGDTSYEAVSPFTVTANVGYGYDDNVNPLNSECNGAVDSGYISASIGATYAESRSNKSLQFTSSIGAIHYFEDVNDISDISPTANLGLNLGYQVNDRIRLTSNNFLSYGLEPDYERGIAQDRRAGEYFAYSSFNTIGIRWTERFGTNHSVGFAGAIYDSGVDYHSVAFRNELRYRLSERTVLKAGHNLSFNDTNSNLSQSYFAGAEHALSQRAGVNFEVGGSLVDGAHNPYANVGVTYAASDRLNFTGYARYDTDDIFVDGIVLGDCNSQFQAAFETRTNLRVGGNFNYNLSRKAALHGGVAYVNTSYNDRVGGGSDFDATLYHGNLGLTYQFTRSIGAYVNYNHTTSSGNGDAEFFDYDRNRYNLGLSYTF